MIQSVTHKIILASNSPRRRQILKDAGFDYTTKVKDTPEDFPADMPVKEIPLMLAKRKAHAFKNELQENELIITADTVVVIDNKVLNKPADQQEALSMLRMLSGRMHEVITGVCLLSKEKEISFSDLTQVYFLPLSEEDIEYYIENFKPFDKAGSYGIQEYIGYIGIEKISGSYFNVMGLPIHRLVQELRKF